MDTNKLNEKARKGFKKAMRLSAKLAVAKAEVTLSPKVLRTFRAFAILEDEILERVMVCPGCGKTFLAARRDAKTCHVNCRTKLYIQRTKSAA